MLSTPEPPVLAEDAYTQQITTDHAVGEYGSHTFGRIIASHLASLLHTRVDAPLYRENRRDQRDLPKAISYQLTVHDHHVLITSFIVNEPLLRHPLPVYTIHLNGTRIPFELTSYRDLEWQLARTIWIAITDQRITEERQARETAETAALGVQS